MRQLVDGGDEQQTSVPWGGFREANEENGNHSDAFVLIDCGCGETLFSHWKDVLGGGSWDVVKLGRSVFHWEYDDGGDGSGNGTEESRTGLLLGTVQEKDLREYT